MYVVAQFLCRAMSYLGVRSQKASVDLVPDRLPQELAPVESAHAVNKMMEVVHLHCKEKNCFAEARSTFVSAGLSSLEEGGPIQETRSRCLNSP